MGHPTGGPGFPLPPPTPQNAEASEVRALAHRYRQAGGQAFASGEDAEAATYREAAEKLTALANELPPLPRATR